MRGTDHCPRHSQGTGSPAAGSAGHRGRPGDRERQFLLKGNVTLQRLTAGAGAGEESELVGRADCPALFGVGDS